MRALLNRLDPQSRPYRAVRGHCLILRMGQARDPDKRLGRVHVRTVWLLGRSSESPGRPHRSHVQTAPPSAR
jgi:hypothetical protein